VNDESRLLANVSIHPEVPAAGHIKFFLSIIEETLSWCPKSTLHYMLLMPPSQY